MAAPAAKTTDLKLTIRWTNPPLKKQAKTMTTADTKIESVLATAWNHSRSFEATPAPGDHAVDTS